MNTAHASILAGALAALALAAPLSVPEPSEGSASRAVASDLRAGSSTGSATSRFPSMLDDAASGIRVPDIPASGSGSAASDPGSGSAPASRVAPAGRHVWPTGEAARVLRSFDPPEQRWLAGHRGVDLELEQSAPVYASAAGTVVYAGRIADRFVVSIEHSNGLRTTYEPVAPVVARGQSVARGEIVGHLEAELPQAADSSDPDGAGSAASSASGNVRYAHCGAVSCLHWGAKRSDGEYVNPLALLSPAIRLLG